MRLTMTGVPLHRAVVVAVVLGVVGPRPALAQEAHMHTPAASGVPMGIPYFCANPTVVSVGSGSWSNADTWSTHRVPGPNDKVAITARHEVGYDVASDVPLNCVEVNGHLRFSTTTNTRMKVRTLMVTEAGYLEIGSAAAPIVPNVIAEVVIVDQPTDPAIDPAQFGNGVVGLGKVSMHGAPKTPTFVRLKQEPLAGQMKLTLEQAVAGWKAGDRVIVPDTRQLRTSESGAAYRSQAEKLTVASVAGVEVTLSTPLRYDHKGARNTDGQLRFLPHVGNVTRNIIIRSENPEGTRGHTMFVSRANVDVRYVQFSDLGRTRSGVLRSTDFDSEGRPVQLGSNQIGRYAVHFHHTFGPKETPANGYQFTLIGNAIDGAKKWGITVHQSHYGLIQDNVVYATGGAGIVTEDGTESFNVFDHNCSVRSAGSGQSQSRINTGYGPGDPGGEGAGFWFRGPNNFIRNNVAANGDEFGFGLAPAPLGIVRTPAFKGADTSKAAESKDLDTRDSSVLEFSNNEAYGAMQSGIAFGWSGTISNVAVWHASRHAVTGTPTATLTVDRITARGDPTILANPLEKPVGLWFGDYSAANIVLSNADIEGVRIGVSSPFFYSRTTETTKRQNGSMLIENGHFRTQIGVNVATAYAIDARAGAPVKKVVVRSSVFDLLEAQVGDADQPEAISMNYGMMPNDPEPRDPILVYDYNKQPGKTFSVYYSKQAPPSVAPCHDTVAGIGGWVCPVGASK